MHLINSNKLSRRHMLKGAGALMALPLLEAMGAPKQAATNSLATGPDGQPIRYASVFMPNGAVPGDFVPKGNTLDKLPDTIPLGKWAQHSNVITGLSTSFGGHVASTAGFLTGNKPLGEKRSTELDIGNASIDQIIGKAAKGTCPLPTLELALHSPRRGTSPSGYSWLYGSYISWKDGKTPVPQEVNPQRAFNRLFEGVGVTKSGMEKQKKKFSPDKSVVDLILDDAKSLQRRLGHSDRDKLDQYLTAVSEVESRIFQVNKEAHAGVNITEDMLEDIQATGKRINGAGKSGKGKISAVPNIPYPTYVKLMMDVTALAFWSNSTRASTIMLGDGGSRRNMSFINGVKGDHHQISHHGNKPEKLKMYSNITNFYVEQYTYFLSRLASMDEGGTSVLDNSFIMMGSGFGNGQVHAKTNIPMITSGSAGGRIKNNRHIKAGKRVNISSLHKSVLEVMNIEEKIMKGKPLKGFV